ncbi:MAG: radical SAM protein [Spirochaetes bacterium]|nr:radical SAM protein [Spirochaetota bacterium]
MAKIGYIQVTRLCSQSCIFCSSPPNDRSLSLNEGKKIIDGFSDQSYEGIIFTGGEPSLYENLYELINYACQKKIHTRIITNGQKLSDKKYITGLADSGLDHVHISLHSCKPDIQAFLTKNEDSLKNIDTALANLKELGLTVDINTVINSYNADHLDKTVEWVLDKYPFIHHFVWNNLDPFMTRVEENPDVIPKFKDFEISLFKACSMLNKSSRTFRIERVPLCYMAEFARYSTETRKIVKKESRTVFFLDSRGKLVQNKFSYVKKKACSFCSLNSICAGVYKGNSFYSGNEVFPVFLDKEKIIKSILNG